MAYEYLKRYVDQPENIAVVRRNWFHTFDQAEIEAVEKGLGYSLPSQLKDFYREIGYGCLAIPNGRDNDSNYRFFGANRINAPDMILATLNGDPDMMISDVEFASGELPFFEIADGSQFLIMKPLSDNPNAVYQEGGVLIEDNFEKFIWRLYYEDPSFYDMYGTQAMYESRLESYIHHFGEEQAKKMLKNFVIRPDSK